MITKLSRSVPLFIGVLSLLAVFLLTGFAPAESETLPVRPTLTPTATPIASPTPTAVVPMITPSSATPSARPAAIYLRVEPATSDLWMAVQWQDGHEWRTVAGWQAPLNEAGVVAWAVAEANFGERPFRWLVYDGPEGELLASSELFALPGSARETVYVTVALPDKP